MPFVFASALKDLLRMRRDLPSLAIWLGIPVVISVLMLAMFGRGSGPAPKGVLLVADEDQTLLSGLLASGFSQGPLGEMLTVEKLDQKAGRRRLDRGQASALMIIPKGFSQAYLAGEQSRITLLKNPSQSILPGIIEEAAALLLEAGFYLQALAGDQFRMFTAAGQPPDASVAATAVAINQVVTRVRPFIDPPLIKLVTRAEQSAPAPPVNFGSLFFPGMLFMSLLFIGQGLSEDFWKERRQGTLRRLAASPERLEWFLGGKLVSAGAFLTVVAVAALVAGRWLLGMTVARPVGAVLWVVFIGLSLYLLMTLLQVYASSERAGAILGFLLLFPLAMIGGCFFPIEIMPAGLARIGRWTPTGWGIGQFKALLSGSVEAGRIAAAFAGVALFALAAAWLALRRLRRAFVI